MAPVDFIPGLLAGLAGGSVAWFTFARTLTTRKDVHEIVDSRTAAHEARITAVEHRQARTDIMIEDIRQQLADIRVGIAKLTVLLSSNRQKPCAPDEGRAS